MTILTQGVGYEVFLPISVLDQLKVDEYVTFWVHTVVREDAITLFGFLTQMQRHLFVSLLKVDRIGPKMALRILSSDTSVDQIIAMIQAKDVKGLSCLPKIGQKMAEQIVLQLKGKLSIQETPNERSSKHQAIASALLNLGFKSLDIEKALLQIPKESSLEDGVKSALAFLSGK